MFVLHPEARIRMAQARIAPAASDFSHEVAARVSREALKRDNVKRVVIDLHDAEDASTAAFAELIRLRRRLLRDGRDLCVVGLHDRAEGVFEVNRLAGALPRA